jgi:hypothetical protein
VLSLGGNTAKQLRIELRVATQLNQPAMRIIRIVQESST